MGLAEEIPTINVGLVSVCAVLLLWGRWLIRHDKVAMHKRAMLTATVVFAVFLALYATRLIAEGPTDFPGPDSVKPYYFAFLFIHMGLALTTVVAIVPMLVWALKTKRFDKHKRLAVWVWPAWLVSIAMGITVYYMLFVRYV